jgi:hypothetical protein
MPIITRNAKGETIPNPVAPVLQRPGQMSVWEQGLALARENANTSYNTYTSNPTYLNKAAAAAAAAEYAKAQASVSSPTQNTARAEVGPLGEGDVPPDSPDTIQTKTAEETAAATVATPDATSFIYSDVNMHYILDKRHVPFRTRDGVKHLFFLESYKSVDAWQVALNAEDATNTRFTGIKVRIRRNIGGDETKEVVEYDVTKPSEFSDADEDKTVDSILWAYSSYQGGTPPLYSKEKATEDQILPILSAGNAGGFLFPVFEVDPAVNEISPMINLKYFNICYNSSDGKIDMSFWSNYRVKEDGTTSSHPFTRQRDLRNVGRALMQTTGWYDKAEITFEGTTYYRNVFMFATPKPVFVPGLGGEFDVDRIEPVVDSVPMGLKFVEFST